MIDRSIPSFTSSTDATGVRLRALWATFEEVYADIGRPLEVWTLIKKLNKGVHTAFMTQ